MTFEDFKAYIPILEEKPFELFPAPQGMGPQTNKFVYADADPTHLKIQNAGSGKEYSLPLVLIEFASVGVLRLTRAVVPRNGNLV